MYAQTNHGRLYDVARVGHLLANAAQTSRAHVSSVKIASHQPTEIPQSSAISRPVSLLLLRTTVLTLAIISSFLDVDGRLERGSPSTEVPPSLNRRNQTFVYDPLHLHRMLAAIIDTFPLRFFRF